VQPPPGRDERVVAAQLVEVLDRPPRAVELDHEVELAVALIDVHAQRGVRYDRREVLHAQVGGVHVVRDLEVRLLEPDRAVATIRVPLRHVEAALVGPEPVGDNPLREPAIGHHPGVDLEVVLDDAVVGDVALAPLRLLRDERSDVVPIDPAELEAATRELVDPLVLTA